MGAFCDAKHILIIINLLHRTGTILSILDDGEGHVGLKSQQTAGMISEGDDLIGY